MNWPEELVVISGASRGIGRALATEFNARGARTVLLARDRAHLENLQRDLGGDRARTFSLDVADVQAVEAMATGVLKKIGTPTVVINNAGAGRFCPMTETSPQELQQMTAVPYWAAFHLTRVFLPAMLQQNRGTVVHLTSPAAYLPWPNATAYAVARWAMRGLHEALRADLHGSGVRSMLVVPGKVSSSYFENNPGSEERLPPIARLIPTLTPEQVARAVVGGLECRRTLVMLPWQLRFMHLMLRLMPELTRRMAALKI